MNHILAAGALVKVINILSHHCQLRHMAGKCSDSSMRPIWLRLDNFLPTPLVPSPTERWVGFLPSVQRPPKTPSEFVDKVARQGDFAQQATEEAPKAIR